jgi:hypothetical protein
MAKLKKKELNSLLSAYNNVSSEIELNLTNPQDENEIIATITVNTSMTIDEKGMFVDRVVNHYFDSNGDFCPQYLDPIFMITLLQMTTNVPVFESEFEENGQVLKIIDIEKTYTLCKAINLVKNVKDERYQHLIQELKAMVRDKLEYRKQMQYNSERALLTKAREELETGIAMVNAVGIQLNEALSKVGTVQEMNDALKNIDYEKLVNTTLAQS